MPLASALFDFDLPQELVAQIPAERRDESRLLVVNRAAGTLGHHHFSDLPRFLRAGDVLFRNNAAVLPARLAAVRPAGGAVECLLLRPSEGEMSWHCLVKPGRKLPVGAVFSASDGAFQGEIAARHEDGTVLVRFSTPDGASMTAVANRCGQVPLPPYIHREGGAGATQDRERYQTVYSDPARQVAVAAPTAGLHFTPGLLDALTALGVRAADLTLHVGLGTFRPIASDTLDGHTMHRELYEIPAATQAALFPPSSGSGGRRIAVGTTAVRSIEDFLATNSVPLGRAHVAEAGIFIYPPRSFRGVDALITNFHQPRSTLLCLVSAFLTPGSTDGIAWWKEIYAEAIARRYRFFSYGDAMLIL